MWGREWGGVGIWKFPREIFLEFMAQKDTFVSGVQRGRKTPTKFLEFMTQKDAFLRPFSPFLYSSDSRGGGGGGDDLRKFFWRLWGKKENFKRKF